MNIPFGREKRRAESYQQMKSQNDSRLLNFLSRVAQIGGFLREFVASRRRSLFENSTLAILMEPHGPRACDLLSRLWLLRSPKNSEERRRFKKVLLRPSLTRFKHEEELKKFYD